MPKQDIQSYLEFIMSAAVGKCENISDAQDLTQETMLCALVFLEKGGIIENPKAWLITVLNRKYYDMLRRKYQLPTVIIGEGFEAADGTDIHADLADRETAEAVRREVSFLVESYRLVIVKHYFHGKSIKEIASEMDLPEGTVKSRLDFGRKQLKKGFETMNNYAENSYMPKCLVLANSGRNGIHDEPWSIVCEDVLAQNLLILAYDKPVSVAELSRLIGVATAYVEPVVRKLVNGELMKQMGDGKVYTDFVIYQAPDWVKYIKEQEAFAQEHIECFTQPLITAIEELKKTDFYSQRLERFMMLQIAQDGLYSSMEGIRKPQIFPDRPNGGKWIAFATVYPENYRIPEENKGREEYNLSGRRTGYMDKYLDAKNLQIHNFESSLDPNSSSKLSFSDYTLIDDIESNMLRLFYLIDKGIAPETVGCDERIIKTMPVLEERGYIAKENGTPKLLIPRLTHAQASELRSICARATRQFAEKIKEPLAEWCKTHKKKIPSHLKSVPDQKLTMPYEPSTMMFVYEAINSGVHPRELGYPCPETLVVFD